MSFTTAPSVAPSVVPEAPLDNSPVNAAPAAPAAAAPPALVYYKHADLGAHLTTFLPLEKLGGSYVARLATPLLVQTPVLALASPLDDDEGEPVPHAHLTLPRGFQQFAEATEAAVLEACLANKAEWFRRPLEDASLRASFKQFCKGQHLKIKVPRDALVFDSQGSLVERETVAPGASVRCLLELTKVCFGRTEFGAMWTLRQAQTAPAPPPPPRCMIDPTADCEPEEDQPEDTEPEFL